MAAQYVIEDLVDVPVRVELASEFRYRKMSINKNSVVIVISQSGETAESVLNQTYNDIQLVVIDDGSTDKTLEIIKEYALTDKRIQFFSQKNAGQAAARNLGLSKAKGEYVQFVDCDDLLEPNAIETLVCQLLANPKASFRSGY